MSDAEPDHRLDVREIEGEPFTAILAALEALGPEESLRLINDFEPEPLYAVLEDRGFAFETTNPDPDRWHVTVERA